MPSIFPKPNETMSSSTSSHSLFSTLLSFFTLILLYFPPFLWTSLLSPPLLLAGFLLLSLLRLGATQRQTITIAITNPQSPTLSQFQSNSITAKESQHSTTASISSSTSPFEESFLQWNVRAPLEVIYEDYEEEEAGEDHNKDDPEPELVRHIGSIERYPSLSLYYPETDSDGSSVDEMENVCFMWDEEDEDRDELIEIALDNKKKPSEFFQLEAEEDNLIEIDISPTAFPMFNNI